MARRTTKKIRFAVGDRAGSPDGRGLGFDAIITVQRITERDGVQWLHGPDGFGRSTTLQGCFCKRLKPRGS